MAQFPGTVSRSAPPPFRAKQRPGTQAPQNKNRLTGPPMQKGKGTGMFADGGFGAPEPIGMGEDPAMPPPPPAAAGGMDPDMDQDMDSPTIRPEAVAYHDDAQSCQTCSHFSGGQCAVLKMQVSPEGGCNAFEGGAPTEDTGEMPPDDAGAGADLGGDEMGGMQ